MKEKPYIDYEKAKEYYWLFNTIECVERYQKTVIDCLDKMQKNLSAYFGILNDEIDRAKDFYIKGTCHYGCADIYQTPDPISELRNHFANVVGNHNYTLYDKLKDKEFTYRFIGRRFPPISKDEYDPPDDDE
jgi:hypothetical protein